MKAIILAMLMGMSLAANAADVVLPDANVTVTHDAYYQTVYVTVEGVRYAGPYAGYTNVIVLHNVYGNHEYVYHYDNMVLTSADGATLLLTADIDYRSVLIRSGHNYYRVSWTVLNGIVTVN